jgi:hypothetical protein
MIALSKALEAFPAQTIRISFLEIAKDGRVQLDRAAPAEPQPPTIEALPTRRALLFLGKHVNTIAR